MQNGGADDNIMLFPSSTSRRFTAATSLLFLICSNSLIGTLAFSAVAPQQQTISRPAAVTKKSGYRSQLLYADSSNHVDAEYRSIESETVARLRRCYSADQVHLELEASVFPTRVNGKNDQSHPLSHNMEATISAATPNVAAAALRQLTKISPTRRQHQDNDNDGTIWALVNHLSESVDQPDGEVPLTRFALLDIVSSLASLEKKRKVNHQQLHQAQPQVEQLSSKIQQRIHDNRQNVLEISSEKLADTLYALLILNSDAPINTGSSSDLHQQQPAVGSIQIEICEKLVLGHYLGKLTPGDMSIILTAMATNIARSLEPAESALVIALTRRFRKQAVRESSTNWQLFQALRSVASIGVQAKESDPKLQKESQLMVYTLFKDLLQRTISQRERTPLALDHVSKMVTSVSSMNVLNVDGDASLQTLWGAFLELQSKQMQDHVTVEQLSRFVSTVEATQSIDLALSPQAMQRIGEQFLRTVSTLVDRNEISMMDTKSANNILRCATLQRGHNSTVMEPFQQCAHQLFTNEEFLANSQARHLTNYMSFLEKTRYNSHEIRAHSNTNNDPLVAIGERILKIEVAETVTPAEASRILSAFTAVTLTRTQNHEAGIDDSSKNIYMVEIILSELFHNLGGHLLTCSPSELSPRDLSSALCAYAKASYLQDMGIFDHLAESLASRVQECSVRQATQSLWACGKMAAWELQHEEFEDGSDTFKNYSEPPPYLPSANGFATFLLERPHEMTSQDVAQTIWALGRLESVHTSGAGVKVDAFVPRATTLAPHLTSQEIANILWGMSQTGWRDCGTLVQPFSERLMDLHNSQVERIHPQEAASVMLAFGRMRIVNKELFEMLSKDILDQLDIASAQSIANALWAYRTLHLSPPRRLLNCWAIERLGLNLAMSPDQGFDYV